MVHRLAKFGLVFLAGLFLVACAAQQPMNPFDAGMVDDSGFVQKHDNYVIVFDASQTMWYRYMDQQKLTLARQFVGSMNHTLPASIDLDGAVRTLGHDSTFSMKPTLQLWGPAAHTTGALDDAVAKITKAGGTTPLSMALDASDAELSAMTGSTALIVVSDGMATDEAPVAAAKALKDRYGDDLCIYPVLIGDSPEGMQTLQGIADAGGCGFFARADALTSAGAMGDWVKAVFYKEKPAPPEPAPAPRMDSDGDGVYDDQDKCPGTPKGAPVNMDGCWILENVLFDFDKTFIREAHFAELSDIAKVLQLNGGLKIKIEAHADEIGTDAYNMDLSKRRAMSVKNWLVKRGAPGDQIVTEWFGERQPVASNATAAGRQLNRRAEFVLLR